LREKLLASYLRGFCYKKSGYFTKPVKTFAVRKANQYYNPKMVHKGTNYSLKVRKEIFATQPYYVHESIPDNRQGAKA
jgi:intein-encoded DNA endonuclease-like protein